MAADSLYFMNWWHTAPECRFRYPETEVVSTLNAARPLFRVDVSFCAFCSTLEHVNRRSRVIRGGLRGAGILVVSDHITDPDPAIAARRVEIEVARDRAHIKSLSGGGLLDLLARVGLTSIRPVEEAFTLNFDVWFDRGTPSDCKSIARLPFGTNCSRAP
jgi:hypothetical protein